MIKLNLGCGDDLREGYINVDLHNLKADAHFNAAMLPYEDNSVDEIMAYHIIEHFDFKEGFEVLKEWYRALKPGGKISIETPDMLTLCRAFANGDENQRVELYGQFFAQPWIPGLTHKFLFTENQLGWQMDSVGFKNIRRVEPDSQYYTVYRTLPAEFYLRVIASK